MSKNNLLNLNWYFKEGFEKNTVTSADLEDFEAIHIPHNVKQIPYNCFDDTCMLGEFTYVKVLPIDKTIRGKRILLEFQGVMTYFELYVNGQLIGEHKGGYTRSLMDVTAAVQYGEDNLIVVKVDTNERPDIPPFGNVIDYITYGGIYRDVYLHVVDQTYIENVHYHYQLEEKCAKVAPQLMIVNHQEEKEVTLHIHLSKEGKVCHTQSATLLIKEGREKYTLPEYTVEDLEKWDLESPHLYDVEVILEQDQQVWDTYQIRVGFRKIEVNATGFYLNDKKIKLVGLNRHQAYPYVGYAMGKRVERRDAEILKYELGLNTVRTSHYPQSQHFLNRCDEIGLLVFEEIPGWQHVSKREDFRQVVLENVSDMIALDFNHPSIFMWGVRINESGDDDALYTQTNSLAKALDPMRPTGGVRCFTKSHLLEDIYTMNDFVHSGKEEVLRSQQEVTGLDYPVPYLVTEYNGHMYPTKKYDNEARLTEHVYRHARIQSDMQLRKDILGAIGWCAFDYNTHRDFGSGDKICYHGVMDMFRLPKFAAFVYKSQISPEQELVLEPVTYYTRGEKDAATIMPIVVLTNCDYVEVIIGGQSKGKYYPSGNYQGLEHPPIIVDTKGGEWGERWQDGIFIGYRAGKEVIRRVYVANSVLSQLKVEIEETNLYSTEVDATKISCSFVDQVGNIMPYYNGVVHVETKGNVEVIGPKTVATVGGSIGIWVKTIPNGEKSEAEIIISAPSTNLQVQTIKLSMAPEC